MNNPEDKIPTVVTQAIKILHPIFQDPSTGQMLPPPDHEFRVCFQLALAPRGKAVQQNDQVIFISGDSIEEIADTVRHIVSEALTEMKNQTGIIKPAPAEALHVLKKFGDEA